MGPTATSDPCSLGGENPLRGAPGEEGNSQRGSPTPEAHMGAGQKAFKRLKGLYIPFKGNKRECAQKLIVVILYVCVCLFSVLVLKQTNLSF